MQEHGREAEKLCLQVLGASPIGDISADDLQQGIAACLLWACGCNDDASVALAVAAGEPSHFMLALNKNKLAPAKLVLLDSMPRLCPSVKMGRGKGLQLSDC